MPPRRRNPENAGLPRRWKREHGAYFYQVPPGLESQWDGKKKFRLGANLAEAYDVFAKRLGQVARCTTVADILERFALQVLPRKAPATRDSYARTLPRLSRVFGHMKPEAIEPWMVYKYIDKRVDPKGRPAKTVAHREIEVLSSALTSALEWGDIREHPFLGRVRLSGDRALTPRTRYVTDDELLAALTLPARQRRGSVRMVQAYLRLKLLTGLRKADLLKLRVADGQPDGIHFVIQKTKRTDGRPRVMEWSPELRDAWQACLDARPIDLGPLLFCTRAGASYVNARGRSPGFDSVWQRFMDRLAAQGVERFTEHDIRAKAGSDAESLERARQLLGHVDARMTAKAYRRAPEKVRPLR